MSSIIDIYDERVQLCNELLSLTGLKNEIFWDTCVDSSNAEILTLERANAEERLIIDLLKYEGLAARDSELPSWNTTLTDAIERLVSERPQKKSLLRGVTFYQLLF